MKIPATLPVFFGGDDRPADVQQTSHAILDHDRLNCGPNVFLANRIVEGQRLTRINAVLEVREPIVQLFGRFTIQAGNIGRYT